MIQWDKVSEKLTKPCCIRGTWALSNPYRPVHSSPGTDNHSPYGCNEMGSRGMKPQLPKALTTGPYWLCQAYSWFGEGVVFLHTSWPQGMSQLTCQSPNNLSSMAQRKLNAPNTQDPWFCKLPIPISNWKQPCHTQGQNTNVQVPKALSPPHTRRVRSKCRLCQEKTRKGKEKRARVGR